MATWTVYQHKNKINGKSYVGITSRTLNERWRNGTTYTYKSGQHKFANAIRKYGWDGFEHIILEKDIPSLQLASEREKYWINYFDSYKRGYNMSPGGAGQNSSRWRSVCQIDPNTYSIIAVYENAAQAARTVGEHGESNIIACCNGRQKTCRGFYWCYTQYKDVWTRPIDKPKTDIILQIDMQTLKIIASWSGPKKAAEGNGHKSGQHISSCCHNKRERAYGYYWCFEKNYYPGWSPERRTK